MLTQLNFVTFIGDDMNDKKTSYSRKMGSLIVAFPVLFLLSTIVSIALIAFLGLNYVTFIVFLILLSITLSVYFYLSKKLLDQLKDFDNAANLLNEFGEVSQDDNLSHKILSLKSSMQKEYATTLSVKQATLRTLQSQINPHFLYNTLDSIRSQALEYKVNEIAEMTEALSSFFRYSVSQSESVVSLYRELHYVETYFKIQRYRFNNRFELRVICESEKLMDYMLPKFTIQPIVENCIFHGLEPKAGTGHITIRIISTGKRIIINISDDGVGMDADTLRTIEKRLSGEEFDSVENEQQGVALMNVHKRIRLLFGEEYGLMISSQQVLGTEIEITLPHMLEYGREALSQRE